jgi:hypothetical protein
MSFYSNNLGKVTGRLGLNTASQGFNKTRGDHIAIKENLSPDQNPESVTPNYYDPFGDQNYKIQYF